MIDYLRKFSLEKKIAYVSGGLGLIGIEISKAFANAGATTIVLDTNRKKAIVFLAEMKKIGLPIQYEYFDVTHLSGCTKSIDALYKKFGGMDIWVNASYPRTNDWGNKLENVTLKSWQKNIDMHMNAYCWISRKVCLLMKANRSGSLINFGSIYGVLGNDFTMYENTTMTGPFAYSAIKGGIINTTRYLASYFGGDNVRVNNICPGGIYDHQNKSFVKNYSHKTPLKRMGTPEEIASAVLFLASDASSYITGTTLMVDGGWSIV